MFAFKINASRTCWLCISVSVRVPFRSLYVCLPRGAPHCRSQQNVWIHVFLRQVVSVEVRCACHVPQRKFERTSFCTCAHLEMWIYSCSRIDFICISICMTLNLVELMKNMRGYVRCMCLSFFCAFRLQDEAISSAVEMLESNQMHAHTQVVSMGNNGVVESWFSWAFRCVQDSDFALFRGLRKIWADLLAIEERIETDFLAEISLAGWFITVAAWA